MGVLKRVLRPAAGVFDRRVDWRIDQTATPRFAARQEMMAVSDSLEKVYADLLEATTDVRRWLADDLDAATEASQLVGRSLVRLTDAVERLSEEVAGLSERVGRLESASG